ncbi:MAG: DUF190 domain-containing protein [Propionivibrio sp.]|uniref:DUF190 domain-containing protein n=1 Tax=Propionivibrio sp. TaxID=2212460 RepID=UPI001A4EA323|nr:DUF190 domain-containing protein [Propionivibrio sp.]MBL8416229.1 DUF190 domain-containing protein [Propionivibrio sp.]
MEGEFLRFYVDEKQSHHGVLLWEWLLQQANKMGMRGGSAFRAIGGFGSHHAVHEERFFELAGSTAIEVEFIANEAESKQLLAHLHQEKIRIFYTLIPARFGIINPNAADSISMTSDD